MKSSIKNKQQINKNQFKIFNPVHIYTDTIEYIIFVYYNTTTCNICNITFIILFLCARVCYVLCVLMTFTLLENSQIYFSCFKSFKTLTFGRIFSFALRDVWIRQIYFNIHYYSIEVACMNEKINYVILIKSASDLVIKLNRRTAYTMAKLY